jgi:hypothetical protein
VTAARLLRPVVAAVLAGLLLAGCAGGGSGADGSGGADGADGSGGSGGSGGSATSCDLQGCTITFPRGGTASVSVLGVEARLVGVEGGQARILVAGQTISVPVGATTQVEGFTVGVERVTDSEVVVRVQL